MKASSQDGSLSPSSPGSWLSRAEWLALGVIALLAAATGYCYSRWQATQLELDAMRDDAVLIACDLLRDVQPFVETAQHEAERHDFGKAQETFRHAVRRLLQARRLCDRTPMVARIDRLISTAVQVQDELAAASPDAVRRCTDLLQAIREAARLSSVQ